MKKKYGPWQQTYTNQIMEFEGTDIDSINIEDIAHALSMQCRFAGHIPKFYSVAEHSYWVSLVLPHEFALWGLMHDAAEAYITDIPTYVKSCVPEIRKLEDKVLYRIALRFDLSPHSMIPWQVKEADRRMLITEKEQFYYKHVRDWEVDAKSYGFRVSCLDQDNSEKLFLHRFRVLINDRSYLS